MVFEVLLCVWVPGLTLKRVELDVIDRLFYPVVPVVVTAEYNERVGGMFAAWWSQLSFKPLLVGVAIAPERYTYKLVKSSGIFALNFLDFSRVNSAPFIGDVSARFLPDKLERAGFKIKRGEVLGAPIIEDAAAAVEARLVKVVELGDHDWFVGEVVAAYAIEDFDGVWRLDKYRPLFYLGRTRRPQTVRRIYATALGWKKVELDFAPGELSRYDKLRKEVLNKVLEIVDEASDREEAVRRIIEVLKEYSLEADDAVLYYDEALRRLGKKRAD